MEKRIKGIIISKQRHVCQWLEEQLSSVVEIAEIVDNPSSACSFIKNIRPQAVFFDACFDEYPDSYMVDHLIRAFPEASFFIVASHKDPELILKGLRCGVTDFFVFPDSEADIAESVKKAFTNNESGQRGGQVFSLFSLNGGQGVTTLAVNLAEQIYSLTKDKVLLLDLNLYRGSISDFLI